jgi:hypothetical protein
LADQTLHSILAEVLLCIEVAMEQVAGHQSGDTYSRCCLVLCGEIYSVEGVAVADAIVTRAHIPADEGVLLLTATLPELLFPVRFVAAWTELFSPSLFPVRFVAVGGV